MDFFTLSHILNFIVVVAVLVKVGRKPTIDGLKSRSENIAKAMDEAKRLAADAEEVLRKSKRDWETSRAQAEKLQADAADMMAKQRVQVLDFAEKRAQRMRDDAKLLADGEVARAKQRLREDVVERSLRLATQFLSQSLGEGERKKLVADSLKLVEHVSAG